ncbi:outer membrane protein with beta-barrel domain [Flavobacterium sp. 90]|uniref:porin family protein n=1 Tax=unclassified Flavobacterium TaxID=196869 RepID=UPI000EB1523C|nr:MULTISPECIES: porin family protein [unclassified Flavobacterium]RKR09269.1 outer membrane protein with beta-barrel domain [Flavobacterium sp. 81]TCK53052.1 outer membrane protein with beta-barrel domain [Flavobacterium sp. 90]
MKKILLLAVLTVLGFTNVNAQKIKFGVKGGLNFANISGDNTKDADLVTSFNFGVLSEIPISEKFSFQPELMYSGQGYSFNDNTVALSYLNVPLMGKYYLTKGFSVEAGPQIGFLLAAKNEKINVKDSFNTVDFGVNFGLGYKLDNGLNFGVRYNLGLTDINNVDNSSIKNKNSVFQVSVGYFFF